MASLLGRYFEIRKNNVVIAQCQSKSLKINNEVIDITNDNSAGFRELAEQYSMRTMDISFDGVADDDTWMGLVLEDNANVSTSQILTDITLNAAGYFAITGNFMVTSYEISGSFDDVVKFSCELQSTGAWSFDNTP